MIKRKIAFHNMDHSDALEKHANERIDKIQVLLEGTGLPQSIEVRFKFNPHGAHHEIEVHLVSKEITTDSHASNSEMYAALDEAMDRITDLVKKSKSRHRDEHHKVHNEKTDFYKKD